jgi:hypothetical protein
MSDHSLESDSLGTAREELTRHNKEAIGTGRW